MQSFINSDNSELANKSMYIPRKLYIFPLGTVRLPKCLAIVSITFLFTSLSTYDTLLLSTYHAILHCLPLLLLFDMCLYYGLILNQCDFRVFEYVSYHSSADYIHTYRAFRSYRFSTFTPLSTCTFYCVWSSSQTRCPQISLRYLSE